MSNKAVTQLLHLHDHMVKDLDIRYMQAWLIKTPSPAPQGIGVDELSIKEGPHVSHRGQRPGARASDLGRQDGPNRSRSGSVILDLGVPKRRPRIRLAVTDRWKAIRNSVQTHTPQAQMLFDTFHILRHLADALDQVRRVEYTRVATKDRAFIRASAYTLPAVAPEPAAGQPALGHRLPAHGGVRATLGLSPRRLGPPVFYPLAGAAQMAMAPALREVCRSG
jgi:transposase